MPTSGLDLLLAPQPASAPQNGLDLLEASQQPIPPNTQQPRGGWEELGRQIGLSGRALAQGIIAIPAMGADAFGGAYNTVANGADKLFGMERGFRFQPTSNLIGGYMTEAGIPAPENSTERVIQHAASAVSGVGATAKLGQFLSNSASPVVQGMAAQLQRNLGNQAVASATGGVSGGVARENGVGPVGQMLAALLGGTVGGVTAASVAPGFSRLKSAVSSSPLFSPTRYAGQQLQGQLGSDVGDVLNTLNSASEIVPGSRPTAAQAAADPRLVMVEKALANASPEFKSAMVQREIDNNSARLAQVGKVAGDPGKLDFFTADRNAAAAANYDKAFNGYDPANLTPAIKGQITQLLKRPAMKDAMAAAQERAQNLGMKLDDSTSVQGLHFAKMELDSAINQAKRAGADTAGLIATRDKLLGVIENLSPDYATARTTYAEMSQPINAMQIGTQLQEKLGGAAFNGAGAPAVTFPTYRNGLAMALRGSKYGIDDTSTALLNSVQDDLQRATISNSIRSPGSDTAFNQGAGTQFLKALGAADGGMVKPAAAGVATAAVTGSPALGAGLAAALRKMGSMQTGRVQDALGELMLDPKKLAEVLKTVNKAPMPLGQDVASRLGWSPAAQLPYAQPQMQVAPRQYSLTAR